MSDWTAGYVADIGYTYGYYNELNPSRARLALLHAGIACPDFGNACELGFGQGMSVNIHAATSTTQWHGNDFNPAQASFARALAEAAGAGASLHDDSFAEFAQRTDLPDFDYIGLHGIWSWISDENRHTIVDFIRRKLKVGGVLYISYNTLPGWAAFAPMRHLMTQHAELLGANGNGIVNRINGALDFTNKFLAINPGYAAANPQVVERTKKIGELDRSYLAHEYFNRDWHPMYYADMADWLAPAKLGFACSAHLLDHIDVANLTPVQIAFLKEIIDPGFRETARDYIVNQQFRRDLWIKGPTRLNALERNDAFRALRVVLVTPRADVPLKVAGILGEITLNESIYQPLLDLLANHNVTTLGQLEQALKEKGVVLNQLIQATLILVGGGHLALVQPDHIIAAAKSRTNKMNEYLMNKSQGADAVHYLASAVTGGGYVVNRFQQLFLLAHGEGRRLPGELALFVWQILTSLDQRLIKDGQVIQTPEENLAELTRRAEEFTDKLIPILKGLQIA